MGAFHCLAVSRQLCISCITTPKFGDAALFSTAGATLKRLCSLIFLTLSLSLPNSKSTSYLVRLWALSLSEDAEQSAAALIRQMTNRTAAGTGKGAGVSAGANADGRFHQQQRLFYVLQKWMSRKLVLFWVWRGAVRELQLRRL